MTIRRASSSTSKTRRRDHLLDIRPSARRVPTKEDSKMVAQRAQAQSDQ